MEQKQFDFEEVTLDTKDYNKVKEIYRLHKEQSYKIFDLSSNISTDEDIMDYVKSHIEYNTVLLALDITNNEYAGCVILEDPKIYNNDIINIKVHLVVRKKYWGKSSRNLIFDCYKFLKDNMKPINRMECTVPSNNYGIIKLLKDVGFKIEGTMKNRLLFKDKNGKEKLYNELIYSNLNLGDNNG